jgi:hypothetical protein
MSELIGDTREGYNPAHGLRTVLHQRVKVAEERDCTVPWRPYVNGVDWQQITALTIVAATAGVFLHRQFWRRKPTFREATACGCSAPRVQTGGGPSVIYHARRGEAPRVTVRMK